ncbi:phosphoenolpyruvate hydrolase family protein [Pseudovibrio exalbescens]|uniref:phosphoenolpyruvate hydrolase family protein n=1 Tax=Pseudovibrio exalbescens TaxID=197461 RepID=UPI000C9BD185|nr:phosphoenolpyruvate hydrolase family protein [Pseudovibrio exalbescens]
MSKQSNTSFIVGAAIGAGATARAAEAGGADFLVVLNAGRYRVRGAPSIACMLPTGNANQLVLDLIENEIAPQCTLPIYAGLSALNPEEDLGWLVQRAKSLGCFGVMNFPSVAHFSNEIGAVLQAHGYGFSREVALLQQARKAGLDAIAHVTTADQAEEAVQARVRSICFNYGWNAGGTTGIRPRIDLKEASVIASEVRRRIREVSPHARLLLEGGPIETAEDLTVILEASRADGYVGGSTLDRLPLETGLANQTLTFKNAVRDLEIRQSRRQTQLGALRQVGLHGASRAIVELSDKLAEFGRIQGPVIATGPVGTGRHRALEALAHLRGISRARLINLNSALMTPQQIKTKLFGRIDRGGTKGLLSYHSGAIVLQDLADLPKHLQKRLGLYLEHGEFSVGGERRRSTSNVPMFFVAREPVDQLVATGQLDPALAEQLQGRELALPPLCRRPEDIPSVLEEAMRDLSTDGKIPALAPLAMRRLRAYSWPGNLTEARNIAGQLLSGASSSLISEADVNALLEPEERRAGMSHLRSEREVILDALWRHGFNRSKTAAFLNVSRKTLYNKIQRYGLTRTEAD